MSEFDHSPATWKRWRLGDLSELTAGGSAPQDPRDFANGTVPFVRMRDVGKHGFTLSLEETQDKLTDAAIAQNRLRLFPVGTILMPKSGSVYTNHRARLGVSSTVVGHLAALLPNDDVFDSRFLTYALRLVDMRTRMNKTTGMDTISREALAGIEIALPVSLDEQRRIAAEITSRLSMTRSTMDALSSQAKTLSVFRGAALEAEMLLNVSGPNWRHTTLGETADLVIGKTPPRGDPSYWTHDLARPFCTISDMSSESVDPVREGVTQAAEDEGKAKRVPKGGLLMSFKLTLGKIGFAARDLFPNEAIAHIIPRDPMAVDLRFLGYWLRQPSLYRGSNTAVMGQTLNGPSLRAIRVDMPKTIEEQRRIVGRLDTRYFELIRAEEAVGRSMADVTALESAILRRAFSGEI